MARVYKRNPNAKKEKVTVPMSSELYAKLREHAARVATTTTAAARAMIEKGVESEAKK
jgi:hypothetical protein